MFKLEGDSEVGRIVPKQIPDADQPWIGGIDVNESDIPLDEMREEYVPVSQQPEVE